MTRRMIRLRALAIAIVGCGFLTVPLVALALESPERPRRVELRVEPPRLRTAAAPATTTSVAPTTTTTVAPTTTTVPPSTTTTTTTAPPPAPPPAEDVWSVYRRCTRGYADTLSVIPGATSWTRWTGGHVTIDVSQWHLNAGGWVLCWTLAHEDGHAYAATIDPASGGSPAGWPYGPERFADCYAQVLVGGQRGTCPDLELAKGLM